MDQIYKADDGAHLRFFTTPVKNNFQSEKAGRAIFDTALMVEVITPGSTESIPQFEVERTYCVEVGTDAEGNRLVERSAKYDQYRAQVEAFKREDGSGVIDGTPLSQWAQIDVGTAASLKAAGIHTVEMLAGVHDGHLQNLGTGGRVLREQARAFIQTRQFGVPSAQMASENANLRTQVERLTAELTAAHARIATLTAATQAQDALVDTGTGPVDAGVTLAAIGLGTPPPVPPPSPAPPPLI